jgi:proline iminopeptidase
MKALIFLLSLALGAAQPATTQPANEGYITGADGARLFYRIEGSGPETLVVVHGGPGNSLESIRLDLAPLAARRRVIYYDQRGGGRSQLFDRAQDLAIDRHVADLEALRGHFGLERMTLFGNSWGGLLVSAYAAAHPDRVERLVLDAPAPPTQVEAVEMAEEFARRAQTRFGDAERRRVHMVFDPEVWLRAEDPMTVCHDFARAVLQLYRHDMEREPRFRGDLCAGPLDSVRRQQSVNQMIWQSLPNYDLRPAVRAVTVPVLVITGESDAIPLSGVANWAANYRQARRLIVPGAGHFVHVEQPQIFFPAVEAFLAGRWPEGAERVE